jgi:hypothetical protein
LEELCGCITACNLCSTVPELCSICVNCVSLPPIVRDITDGICLECTRSADLEAVQAQLEAATASVLATVEEFLH